MPYFEDINAAYKARRSNRGWSPLHDAREYWIDEQIRQFKEAESEGGGGSSTLSSRLRQIAEAERLVEIERLQGKFAVSGDFAGCVNGEWRGLEDSGAGIVRYGDKEYKTENIGFVSNACGERVQLCYAQGKYFASY
jgi:hypothetical protein